MANHSPQRSSGQTVVGKGICIRGEITGSAPIEVWGTIEGISGTEGLFCVREGGKVGGEIAAAQVIVEGRVEGKISAEQKIELRPTCNVQGNLAAKTVAIAEGAFFEGKVSMGRREGQPKTSK
jgi:cytoskeletal protein CcmA (bactofilin family)